MYIVRGRVYTYIYSDPCKQRPNDKPLEPPLTTPLQGPPVPARLLFAPPASHFFKSFLQSAEKWGTIKGTGHGRTKARAAAAGGGEKR